MPLQARCNYYRRIFRSYLLPGISQISFWHDQPELNPNARFDELGEYYMQFAQKADYRGCRDADGIPLIDYHGRIGRQYNPIAIAQWGLGNHSLYGRSHHVERKEKFIAASNWLRRNLARNPHGLWVWNHHFDWEYRTLLKAPWYSALAQGQGISLLVRAYRETADSAYLHAARQAFESFTRTMQEGGVCFEDEAGDLWFEEYLVSPPTHILNGFIWAMWGVWDFYLATGDDAAKQLFFRAVETLCGNLGRYDLGFWSLYEQSGTLLPMVASPFYHRLHIVQLRIMHRLTGESIFERDADRWQTYLGNAFSRARALCYKGAFKLCYY